MGRTQRSVIEILRREPGATIQTIADSLSITHASATYALNQLRAKGLVCQRRDGRTKLNFLVSDANDGNRTSLQPVLADPRKRMMLEMLAGEPHRQRTINWLANRIGASHAFVRRCLPNLVEQGFLALDRTPDRYYIRAQAKLIAFLAKKAPEPEPSARPPSGPPAEGDMVR